MNRLNLILYVGIVVVVLSLAGVITYQQLEISKLYGQNRELVVSNLQKDEENADLRNSYTLLNSTYFQTLNSLGQLTDMLEAKDGNLSRLQQDYTNLTISYNGLLTQYNGLRDSIMELSLDFGGKGGIFILNYTYSWEQIGVPVTNQYTAIMRLYNALEDATVTVKVYGLGGSSRSFTYFIPAYSEEFFVETWDTGLWTEDFSLIMIYNVTR
jgi:hypothetical protein